MINKSQRQAKKERTKTNEQKLRETATNELTDTESREQQKCIFFTEAYGERGTEQAINRKGTHKKLARGDYTDEPVVVPTGTRRRPVPDAAVVVTHSNLERSRRLATGRATFDGFNRHAVDRHASVMPPIRPEGG